MAGVRQFDEEAVLDKAMGLFWKKGYAETTMQELAAVTGVQRGSLYHAYQGKDALFLKVFDLYMDRFIASVVKTLDQQDVSEALTDFFEFVIDSMTAGEPTRGCLTSKTALSGEVIEEPIRQVLQKLIDRLEQALLERLSRPEDSTQLMTSPAEAARLITTFTRGLVVMERVYQSRARLLDTADMLVRLLLGSARRN
ncbi:TetR/AcrR family transcriptional regulator [Herbaspirillum rhizosphaerae]|uniref:TetR/AcrR family transcriptional regulator n=1 Tax=Herbaspirillum rhizosphaerae TaxID=346179 RepID=UPI00067C5C7C|nr:TetR/AcrR family transcriptional regulator [Herbaspirillum rhizosphaerae]